MSIQKSYAVIGLGRYGQGVARELLESGADVLTVDKDMAVVNSCAADFPLCKCADTTDAEVIRQLGIANMDVVIIAMAGDLEASVMTAMLCKEAGVPLVIAKGASVMHSRILHRVGADKVVFPEHEAGIRLAKNLVSAGFMDVIELSGEVSMVNMEIKPEWVGKTLIELNLRRKYGINVVALRRGENVSVSIDPEKPLAKDTALIVIGHPEKLLKLNGK